MTPIGFFYMAKKITELRIPHLVVLEGGYNLEELSLAVSATVRGLLDE